MSTLPERLGCEPIIQGPIGMMNGSKLVADIGEAGAGQAGTLIRELKPDKAVIEEMVS